MSTGAPYVHGYADQESERLAEQADVLAEKLHAGPVLAPGTRVLEVGCGVGAQTVHLLRRHPGIRLTSVDRSEASVAAARARVTAEHPGASVDWHVADLHELPLADRSVDELFVCFVLEHLPDPLAALRSLRRVLRPGGGITAIEGDHGSVLLHPDSAAARAAVTALVDLQAGAGGDALVGRRLAPLLAEAGFHAVSVEPVVVHAHGGRPDLVRGFALGTFTAMVEGAMDQAVSEGLLTAGRAERGVADLRRTAEPSGTLTYGFFRATATSS